MKNTHENIFALQIMLLIQLVWQIVMLIDGVKYDLFPNWLTAVDLSIGLGLFISGIIMAIVKKARCRGRIFAGRIIGDGQRTLGPQTDVLQLIQDNVNKINIEAAFCTASLLLLIDRLLV